MEANLVPFESHALEGEINATLTSLDGCWRVEFEVRGNYLDRLDFDQLKPRSGRQRVEGLWNQNCFEFFLSEKQTPGYREINVSPSGDWNLFRFDQYRKRSVLECEDIQLINFKSLSAPDSYRFSVDFTVKFEVHKIGLSSVLLIADQKVHFAASHPKSKPDFHDQSQWLSWPE